MKEKLLQLKRQIMVIVLAYRHPETPWYARLMAALPIIYAFSPIDLIPDFIPVLGYLDDLLIVPALIALALKFIPKSVLEECQEEAKEMEKDKNLVRWYYALPILLIWLLILFLIVKLFVK